MSSEQRSDRSWFARHKVLTGIGAVTAVVVIASAAGGGGSTSGSASGSSGKKAASAPAPSQHKAPAGIDGNGTYKVGADLAPGTYESTDNHNGCYWERDKDATGNSDSILANDNVTGTSYVTLAASDKYFKSTDCNTWVPVSGTSAGSPKTQVPGDGMYKVGTDIVPGTYKSTGNQDGCYWERDKDATGNSDATIANDNVTGTGVVTILAGDAYFKTSGCSTWQKS